jgi:hypothetical protein
MENSYILWEGGSKNSKHIVGAGACDRGARRGAEGSLRGRRCHASGVLAPVTSVAGNKTATTESYTY